LSSTGEKVYGKQQNRAIPVAGGPSESWRLPGGLKSTEPLQKQCEQVSVPSPFYSKELGKQFGGYKPSDKHVPPKKLTKRARLPCRKIFHKLVSSPAANKKKTTLSIDIASTTVATWPLTGNNAL